MIESSKAEVVLAAELFIAKLDALKTLLPHSDLLDLNEAIYESTDLFLSDAISVLEFLKTKKPTD